MTEVLTDSPLLLLFIVVGLGYLLGNIKLFGIQLGVSAVLFVGLGFGALDKNLKIPEILLFLGLAIFVYSIGLSNGQSFFNSFKQKEKKNLYFIGFMLLFTSIFAIGVHILFGFNAATTAGLYAGSGTSSAALASLLDLISSQQRLTTDTSLLDSAVIGYSIAYPLGVLGVMLAIIFMEKILNVDYVKEFNQLSRVYPIKQNIINRTIKITQSTFCGIPLRDLREKHAWKVIFGRLKRDNSISLTNWDTTFQVGDIVRLGGSIEELDHVEKLAGEEFPEGMPNETSSYAHKRIFVSNPDVVGKRIDSLNISEKFSAILTRVQRGDTDLLAKGETVLELGDRVRFIARRKDIPRLIRLFGNSYHNLSHINLFSFGIGLALGLLLGMVTFVMPGGISFQLGFAGGPLVIALILGSIRRTGPILWTLPYSASLTLRQLGLIFLLATVGVRSGHTFVETLTEGNALLILLAGILLTFVVVTLLLWIGSRFFKIPFSLLSGMVANQPAILDFSMQRSKNQLPSIGFTLMFPIGLIVKIVIVQVLYLILGGF